MKTIHIALASLATIPFIALAACSGSDSGSLPDDDVDDQTVDSGTDASPGHDSGTPGRDSGTPDKDSGTSDDAGDDDAGPSDAGDDDAQADSGTDAGPTTFKVSGTILNAVNTGLVIRLNGDEELTIAPNATSFQFTKAVASGSPYAVTIKFLPTEQACKVTSGTGTIGGADVTNVVVDCENRSSCKTLLADFPAAPTGSYLIDPDGAANAIAPFVAYCDMTFDDGQGGGAGGWTLIEATADKKGPTDLTVGPVAPGSATYLDGDVAKALAAAATQVHIRTPGAADTESATSTPDSTPIVNLRNGDVVNTGAENTDFASLWTGPYANAGKLNFTCSVTSTWPSVYHACGNANGPHLVQEHSRWQWSNGNAAENTDMEVYVR